MQAHARDEYLATQVLTATPEKLQLMLVEAALRLSLRAEGHFEAGQVTQAITALLGAQRILARLIGQLNYLGQPALAGQMAAVYGFIYKSLVIAQLRRDRSKMADAIRVLRVERETWRLACEKAAAGQRNHSTPGAPTGPHFSHLVDSADDEQPHTPISFEA